MSSTERRDNSRWQIGSSEDISEDEKTRLVGSYQRYRLTERPDEVLQMPENTATGMEEAGEESSTGLTGSSRLPAWSMLVLGIIGALSAGLTAVLLLLWLL
jgi:hypothetical protein